jgi:hypothetical protein
MIWALVPSLTRSLAPGQLLYPVRVIPPEERPRGAEASRQVPGLGGVAGGCSAGHGVLPCPGKGERHRGRVRLAGEQASFYADAGRCTRSTRIGLGVPERRGSSGSDLDVGRGMAGRPQAYPRARRASACICVESFLLCRVAHRPVGWTGILQRGRRRRGGLPLVYEVLRSRLFGGLLSVMAGGANDGWSVGLRHRCRCSGQQRRQTLRGGDG